MPSSSPSPTDAKHFNLTPKILEFRDLYRSCHIRLPGEERRVAAVLVDGKYYSLSKVVKNSQKALEISDRLISKGNEAVITKLAKGYAVWRLEPDALVDSTTQTHLNEANQEAEVPICRILGSLDQYRSCHIRVPDLDKRLVAIEIDGNYYGLLKVVDSRQQALSIVTKLKPRSDEIIITKIAQSEAIWVLEPDARLDE